MLEITGFSTTVLSSASPSTARTPRDREMAELNITKSMDKASPRLQNSSASGSKVDDAEIDFATSGSSGGGSTLTTATTSTSGLNLLG